MHQLDVRGEICPYPMLRAIEMLKKLPDGEGLEILLDHPPALSTIPWEAAKLGYEAKLESAGQSEWRINLTPRPDANRKPGDILNDLNQQIEALSLPE